MDRSGYTDFPGELGILRSALSSGQVDLGEFLQDPDSLSCLIERLLVAVSSRSPGFEYNDGF